VCDQHTRYFESRGEVRHPRQMFQADLLHLIRSWKTAGDEIILMGDFNENIYEGNLARNLLHEDIRMSELCQHTTGSRLPNTHIHGSVPVDAVFATAGISCTAVTLLPHRVGVGDHYVFLLDIESDTLLGDVFPQVIPISRRLLNCASDTIKNTYILVLNQLTSRHLIYKKLHYIQQDSTRMTHAQLQLRMNKVNLELEDFVTSSEKDCQNERYRMVSVCKGLDSQTLAAEESGTILRKEDTGPEEPDSRLLTPRSKESLEYHDG
jgi:hypothetical protein